MLLVQNLVKMKLMEKKTKKNSEAHSFIAYPTNDVIQQLSCRAQFDGEEHDVVGLVVTEDLHHRRVLQVHHDGVFFLCLHRITVRCDGAHNNRRAYASSVSTKAMRTRHDAVSVAVSSGDG